MFWKRFSELCKKAGKKPNPVGKEIGVSSGTVTKWKNGAIPSGENLYKISEYFNVSIEYLIGQTDNEIQQVSDLYLLNIPEMVDFYLNEIKNKGFTEVEFLNKCNIDINFFNDWKSHKILGPSFLEMNIMAENLNVSFAYLFTLGDETGAKWKHLFFDKFKSLCKKNNTTPVSVATKLGYGERHVAYWEKGKFPSGDELIAISKYFKVSIDYLLGRADDPTPTNKKAPPKPEPDIKWGDFGISFYEGGKKKLTQAQKDKIAKLVQIAVMDEEEYWKNEKGTE